MMDRRIRIGVGCGALVLLAALAGPAHTQEVPGLLAPRVRVSTALAVAATGGRLERIPWPTVVAVDVSRGRPRPIGRFALFGAGFGGALGAVMMATCNDSGGFLTCAEVAPVVIGGSMGIGAMMGALMGSLSPGLERWEQLPIRPDLGVVPTSTGDRP